MRVRKLQLLLRSGACYAREEGFAHALSCPATDHDFLLSREDLLKYQNHALTFRIVDRIFSQPHRRCASGVAGRMDYKEFVYFILSGGGGCYGVGKQQAACHAPVS